MTTSEKVAYIKGLAEGLALDAATPEGKLFKNIIDVLEDIALDLEDINDNALDLADEIDELSDDLAAVEDIVYDDDDDEDDDEDEDDDDECLYSIECPTCHSEITVDEGVIECGSFRCPECGETLEIDDSDDDECCECDCDCDCDKDDKDDKDDE